MRAGTELVRRGLDRYARFWLGPRHDLHALQALEPLSGRYLPWTSFALAPAALVTVLNDIVVNRRRHVVECGGGVSTVYIARLLAERGGHLHTIEDDPAWAGILREALEAEGLTAHATVIHAALEPTPLGWRGGESWYSAAALDGATSEPIDMLLVDGPAAHGNEIRHARYPALPYFRPFLAPDFVVILDDIPRRGEQEVVDRWEREAGLHFTRRFSQGRIALAHSAPSYWV